MRKRAGREFGNLFETITSDNGIDVYIYHPYASWERGISENQHKLIRRFIPKGKPISEVSGAQCLRIQQWMNDYPRKIPGYQTPHECFTDGCLIHKP